MEDQNVKHEAFLQCLSSFENKLNEEPEKFTRLASQCSLQGIYMPISNRSASTSSDEGSVQLHDGTSVREFLQTVADSIRKEEKVYEKFVGILGADPEHEELYQILASHPSLTANLCTQDSANEYVEELQNPVRPGECLYLLLTMVYDCIRPVLKLNVSLCH